MLRSKALIGIALAAALGVSALAAYVRLVPHGIQPSAPAPAAIVNNDAPHQPESQTTEGEVVTIFTPHMGASGIEFESADTTVPSGSDPKLFAVAEFLKAAQITAADARILGVSVVDGIAHLGFNHSFDHGYGTFEEKSLLDGFAATLGQFKGITGYVLEVDGKPIATLGSVSLTDPVPVIQPAKVPRSQPTNVPAKPTDLPVKPTTEEKVDPASNPGPATGPIQDQAAKDSEPLQPSSPNPAATNTPPKKSPALH